MKDLRGPKDLTIGKLYEIQINDWRGRIPWFEYSVDRTTSRPKEGSYVVYLGESPHGGIPSYSFLSSDGKMCRVYNTNFVHGIKEIDNATT